MREYLLWGIMVLFFGFHLNSSAQQSVSGKVIDASRGKPLSFAALYLLEADVYTQTDKQGKFSFTLSQNIDTATLRVQAIGLDTTLRIPTKSEDLVIELLPHAMPLGIVTAKGYTARGVVEQMIANMDSNYFKFSYGAAAFYRQYQKVNGDFANLMEAKAVTLFRRKQEKEGFAMQEAHAMGAVRKSTRRYLFEDFRGDEYYNLFYKNPIYHMVNNSLDPHRFRGYNFSFDTTTTQKGCYVVRYRCNEYSAEVHGVDNHYELDRYGEAREEGRLVIDEKTFALLEFERRAIRNPYYNYPGNDNYLLPNKEYKLEFANAYLKINFTKKGGQYVMNRMLYWFANEYRNKRLHTVDFKVTECFEWYAMKFSRTVGEPVLKRLGRKTDLIGTSYPYEPQQWAGNLPEAQFANWDQLEADIRSFSANNELFETNP